MALIYDKEVRIYRTLCGSDNNNAYLIVCPVTMESIIIDAPLDPGGLLQEARDTQVKLVLITHSHKDHWEGLKEVKDATGALVGAHTQDAFDIPIHPDILIPDRAVLRAGTIEVKAIHTPGHTPGSVCYLAGDKHLFSGDTLFAGGVGHTPSVEELELMYRCITEKLYVLSDDTLLFPGHGADSTVGIEKEEYRALRAEHPDVLPPIPGEPSG